MLLRREDVRNLLKNEILKIIREFELERQKAKETGVYSKSDGSLVTEVDLKVSDLIKSKFFLLGLDASVNFYSEEDIGNFKFPLVILDPIDGTKELVKGIGECAVSLAIIKDEKDYDYWVFNPFTGVEIFKSFSAKVPVVASGGLRGAVSRTEWEDGLFRSSLQDSSLTITPIGSIANKLMLLALGELDFVISYRPKNIWDIAGGTLALWDRGYSFYSCGKLVNRLDSKLYESPLLWCKETSYSSLSKGISFGKF